jgi:antitoxin MazE
METTIQKWGNSLGVRLPKNVTESQSLKAGSIVRITTNKTGIAITVQKKPAPTLSSLLKGISPKNKHAEVDWGKALGGEIW